MDRTGWIGIAVCLALLFGWNIYVNKTYPPRPHATSASSATASPTTASPATTSPATLQSATSTPLIPQVAGAPDLGSEKTAILENDFIRATITSYGGAIKNVVLKKHVAEGDALVTLNQGSSEGVFNLRGWEGDTVLEPYQIESNGGQVICTRKLANGVEVKKIYSLNDDYQMKMVQTVSNPTQQTVQLPPFHLNVGTASPIHAQEDPQTIDASWFSLSENIYKNVTLRNFDPGTIPLLGIQTSPGKTLISSEVPSLTWTAAKNQFFALIVTMPASNPAQSASAERVQLPAHAPKPAPVPMGIKTSMTFTGKDLAPGASVTDAFSLYAGPKQYSRLHALPQEQDRLMDFGIWEIIIKFLLVVMNFIHKYVANYGVVVILLTVLINLVLWPLKSSANQSMKKMQAVSPKVEELREKFKDDPQRLNNEMIKLYKEYGINPAGGCLPLLVQMPIFLAFYSLLRSSIELRNASFLWVKDLSQPDTIAHIPFFDVPLNPLPLIMTTTSILLMRMTPSAKDNPQMKIAQFMPLMFLAILYKMAAALSLYWTINNLISLVQTYRNLRKPVPAIKKLPKSK